MPVSTSAVRSWVSKVRQRTACVGPPSFRRFVVNGDELHDFELARAAGRVHFDRVAVLFFRNARPIGDVVESALWWRPHLRA